MTPLTHLITHPRDCRDGDTKRGDVGLIKVKKWVDFKIHLRWFRAFFAHVFSCDSSSRSPPVPSFVSSFVCSCVSKMCFQRTFVPLYLGTLTTWQLGNLVTWQLSNLATWPLGHLATWQLGNMATWKLGKFANWHIRNLATWQLATLLDTPAGRTSGMYQFSLFEALASSHIWKLTF